MNYVCAISLLCLQLGLATLLWWWLNFHVLMTPRGIPSGVCPLQVQQCWMGSPSPPKLAVFLQANNTPRTETFDYVNMMNKQQTNLIDLLGQVLIQETGEQRLLGVGIVGKDYGNHSFPGRENGSVGYLIDDGRILDAENPTWGIACDGEKLNRAILFHYFCL